MSLTIDRYEAFDADIANQTIGHLYRSPIEQTSVKGLGEGVGLMSSIAQAELTLASGEVHSVIVKCSARSHNSELSKGLNFYRNEVNFYRHLSQRCPMQVPESLYAAVDPETQEFLLVLEDLSHLASADQLKAVSYEELVTAFERAAEMHATFWEETTAFDWLYYQIDMRSMLFRRDQIFRPGIAPAQTRFPEHFDDARSVLIENIAHRYTDLFARAMGGPQTIVHGDYRTDNLFWVVKDGATDLIAFDWQNTMGGSGTHDISYFSLGCVGDDLRGAPELSALRRYHEVLTDQGVRNFSFDECHERYRFNMLINMITPIAVAGTLDQGNERGQQLASTWLHRGFAAVESLNCEELL